MEDAFIIRGGTPLKGEVKLSGAKNIALKVLTAALLYDGPVVLENIPDIADIHELIHLFNLLGAKAEFTDKHTVTIDSSTLKTNEVDLLHASKIRASFLLFAPLLYRFKKAIIPNPGGCRLGARSIDRVVEGLKSLGIELSYESSTGYYTAVMNEKPHGMYHFEKSSHTGTELMIMMSVFGEAKITIENAALEPEIDNLIAFLNEGGAKIKREESNIVIEGVEKLHQVEPFTIDSDRVEAVTYAVLGIASKGEIIVGDISLTYLKPFLNVLDKVGAGYEEVAANKWRFFYKELKPVTVETTPHPGFLTDWQPLMAILLTQASGKSIIHERIFENRFSYVEELRRVGAKIEYIDYPVENPKTHYFFNYDPDKAYSQTIQIHGPQELHGGVMTVSDLRAGATLAIAALIADGESYVTGIHHLERGYEDFVGKVTSLGGDIRKI